MRSTSWQYKCIGYITVTMSIRFENIPSKFLSSTRFRNLIMSFTISQWVVIHTLFFSLFLCSVYSTENTSTLWTNNKSALKNEHNIADGSVLRGVLSNDVHVSNTIRRVACVFHGSKSLNKFYLSVAVYEPSEGYVWPFETLWTANRNKPVRENATLELTSMGDLVLRDDNGHRAWSTNTSGNSTVFMKLSGNGNLILYNASTGIVWQSFDHPRDTWLPEQRWANGQKLVASVSDSNISAGPFHVELLNDTLYAFIGSIPPQLYGSIKIDMIPYVTIDIHRDRGDPSFLFRPNNSLFQFIRLHSDGHFKVRRLTHIREDTHDIFRLRQCDYPTVCGAYGVCSYGSCHCPLGVDGSKNDFAPVDNTMPTLGCVPTTRLSCENLQLHALIDHANIDYFNFIPAHTNVGMEICKKACLEDCSCKAVIFRWYANDSTGNCSLPNNLFSLKTNSGLGITYKSSTSIKIQRQPNSGISLTPLTKLFQFVVNHLVVRSFIALVLGIMISYAITILCQCKNRRKVLKECDPCDNGYDSLDQVSGMPKRFSFKDLKSATDDFSKMLGEGGFGSVFEGNDRDGTKIAVKRLDHVGQGRKEYLAEVKTMGNIHHVNLVRLLGFCATDTQKLLVYEYMCNGSLDKWIFQENQEASFDWETRRKIILGVAKGLSYLLEECQERIVHLDIKPQNILLDDKFNAKVSDFGLAKFIDKDQSQVMTVMRGTRGYLAPEWFLNRSISEKVDVYSFGVVVLEIICGRKNLDHSLPECLLQIVKTKAEGNRLFDVVDKKSEEMKQHREAVVKMIRIAIWCLHGDSIQRPSMSMIIKVLEGLLEMETITDYSFLTLMPSPMELPKDVNVPVSDPPSPIALSGPR